MQISHIWVVFVWIPEPLSYNFPPNINNVISAMTAVKRACTRTFSSSYQ